MTRVGNGFRGGFNVGPVALAVLVYAGQLKQNPLLEWFPGDLTLVFGVVVVLASFVARALRGPASGYVVLPYAVWMMFLPAVLLSPSTEYAQDKIFTLFTISLILAVSPFYLLRYARQQRRFLFTLVVISVFAVIYSVVFDDDIAGDYSTGLTFDGADTIGTGRIAMTGALICLIVAIRARVHIIARLLLLGITVTTALLAVFSGSRGPLVGIVLAFLIVVVLAPGFRSKRGVGAFLFGSVALGVVWLAAFGPADSATRAFSVFTGETDSSVNVRFEMWDAAWQQMLTSPFGSGWGGFVSPSRRNPYPHNLFLEVGVEAGIIVAIVLVAFIGITVLRALKSSHSTAELAILSLLLFGMFNALISSDINGNRLFIVAIFAVWAGIRPVTDPGRAQSGRAAGYPVISSAFPGNPIQGATKGSPDMQR